MSISSGRGNRWLIIVLTLLLGTFLGIYLQKFDLTARLFGDVTRAGFDLRDVDLIFMKFGIMFSVRLNLGTLLGGLLGLWITR